MAQAGPSVGKDCRASEWAGLLDGCPEWGAHVPPCPRNQHSAPLDRRRSQWSHRRSVSPICGLQYDLRRQPGEPFSPGGPRFKTDPQYHREDVVNPVSQNKQSNFPIATARTCPRTPYFQSQALRRSAQHSKSPCGSLVGVIQVV